MENCINKKPNFFFFNSIINLYLFLLKTHEIFHGNGNFRDLGGLWGNVLYKYCYITIFLYFQGQIIPA